MDGSLVPFRMGRSEQCVFFYGSDRSVWEIRGFTDIGNLGTALGLGKDKGMEIHEKAWGCLCSIPSSWFLWLSHF